MSDLVVAGIAIILAGFFLIFIGMVMSSRPSRRR